MKSVLRDLRSTGSKRERLLAVMGELRGKKVGNNHDVKDLRVILAKMFFEVFTDRFRDAFGQRRFLRRSV
jgi:hypothetical protein